MPKRRKTAPHAGGDDAVHSIPHRASLPSGNDPAALSQVSGWNWGAFLASWVWAFAHRLPVLGLAALLGCLFWGVIGFACAIYLGITGSELAWRSRPFASVTQFREVQRRWAKWGLLVFLIHMLILLLALLPRIRYLISAPSGAASLG